MNRVILIGRLTKDPDVRDTYARYTLAVDRAGKPEGDQPTADFISCVVFGKAVEFAEKYLKKGTKIAVEGRIQTGSYTNKDGQKVYTTDIVVDRHEFCESKGSGAGQEAQTETAGSPEQATQEPVPGFDADKFNELADELPFK